MTRNTQQTIGASYQKALSQSAVAVALAALTFTSARTVQAQQAVGVPFAGKNHLSFYVTELSRDGIGKQRAAVFGGLYGRTLNQNAPLQLSMIVRAAARALEGAEDGIVDAEVTLAATHAVKALGALSLTGAASLGAVAWGQESNTGRVIVKAPLTAGAAYDIRLGRATIAPFVSVIGAYSRERDYLDGERTGADSGWHIGNSAGVSLRFKETVLSVRGISRERGMPNPNRIAFTAGMSW
jgi:hypothetical protein